MADARSVRKSAGWRIAAFTWALAFGAFAQLTRQAATAGVLSISVGWQALLTLWAAALLVGGGFLILAGRPPLRRWVAAAANAIEPNPAITHPAASTRRGPWVSFSTPVGTCMTV